MKRSGIPQAAEYLFSSINATSQASPKAMAASRPVRSVCRASSILFGLFISLELTSRRIVPA